MMAPSTSPITPSEPRIITRKLALDKNLRLEETGESMDILSLFDFSKVYAKIKNMLEIVRSSTLHQLTHVATSHRELKIRAVIMPSILIASFLLHTVRIKDLIWSL